MLNKRRRRATPTHPDDSVLERLAEDGGADAAARAHTAGCPRCGRRVAELHRLRVVVREAALREERPRRDLAGAALARLRARQRAGSRINELLAGLSAFLRGLTALFAHPEADQDTSGTPRVKEGQRHE